MPRPTSRPGTANRMYRRRIPEDVRCILGRLPDAYRPPGWGDREITITLGTSDARKAAAEHARIADEVEQHMQGLRAGPRTLTRRQAVALAGTIYAGFTQMGMDEPEHEADWQRVLTLNDDARRRSHAARPLAVLGCDRSEDPMEARFGVIVDTFLGSEALIVDDETRHMLFREFGQALDEAATRMVRESRGDFRPDPAAERYPKWMTERPQPEVPGLKMLELFDQWASHPEQAQTARRTKARYRGVVAAAAEFLGNPDAASVTEDALRGYLEARMAAEGADRLLPKVARDVHRAALSSLFGWAVDKRLLARNPAAGVKIKVTKAKRLRGKEATDAEVRTLVAAILAEPADAPARTFVAAVRWCLLIAMYTGCRIGEACQLRRRDVQAGSLPMIEITPAAGDVKDGEPRMVPVHPRLVELGLLDFVAGAGDGPLFYDPANRRNAKATTPQSELLAADLVTWARGHGLGDPLLIRPLHALRHRFMTLARGAGIERQYAASIAGHEPGSINEDYGSYPPAVLHREINRLTPAVVEGHGPVAAS